MAKKDEKKEEKRKFVPFKPSNEDKEEVNRYSRDPVEKQEYADKVSSHFWETGKTDVQSILSDTDANKSSNEAAQSWDEKAHKPKEK